MKAYDTLRERARNAFVNSERRIADRCDPYAPMLYGHWATFEAMQGDNRLAFSVAAKGIKAAMVAREERANTPDARLNLKDAVIKRGRFMAKQATRSLIAAGLAATRPLETHERPQQTRRAVAMKTLGPFPPAAIRRDRRVT